MMMIMMMMLMMMMKVMMLMMLMQMMMMMMMLMMLMQMMIMIICVCMLPQGASVTCYPGAPVSHVCPSARVSHVILGGPWRLAVEVRMRTGSATLRCVGLAPFTRSMAAGA